MQIWAESGKSALPICNYSQILYQFLTFTQNLKRSLFSSKSGDCFGRKRLSVGIANSSLSMDNGASQNRKFNTCACLFQSGRC